MRTLTILASLGLGVLVLGGCTFFDNGFRFHGEYRAPKSQFQIAMISQGFVKSGHDIAESSTAIVQFCSSSVVKGRSFQVSMIATPNEWIKVECADLELSTTEWNWKTSEKVVGNLLTQAGYTGLVEVEVKDIARAMESALAGPKGFVMKGQGQSIEVLRADIEYGYKVEKNKPQNTWVNSRELPRCGPQ
jgi:hypothetical protein